MRQLLLRPLILVIFMGTLFSLSNCTKSRWFSRIVYEGTVYDSIGGHPITIATVELDACRHRSGRDECDTYTVGNTITDATGHFRIEAKEARTDRYSVYITYAPGFDIRFGHGNSAHKSDLESDAYTKIFIYP
jgi:hypothetical protein